MMDFLFNINTVLNMNVKPSFDFEEPGSSIANLLLVNVAQLLSKRFTFANSWEYLNEEVVLEDTFYVLLPQPACRNSVKIVSPMNLAQLSQCQCHTNLILFPRTPANPLAQSH